MSSWCLPVPRRTIASTFLLVGVLSVFFNIYLTQVQTKEWREASAIDATLPLCQGISSDNTATGANPRAKNTTIIYMNKHQPLLYHCGGCALNRNLQPTLKSVFEEYRWVDLRRISDWRSDDMLASSSNPWDIFISNYQLDECQDPAFYRWLQLRFAGKILFWTPEDATNYLSLASRPKHFYPLGPESTITLTFLQTAFWAQIPIQQKLDFFVGSTSSPPKRPRSNGKHFLIYSHSNCVGERQTAFRKIANFDGGRFPTVYYGGRCNGGMNQPNLTKSQKYPNNVRLSNWEDNRHVYQDFRFCLTMEHVNTPGYITEKILVAFWAGCVPIYWGPKEIFDIFRADAFIYWDVDDPQPALERILHLEQNQTAYEEVLRQPILARGAVEKYFSMDESIGGGKLKTRIREYVGLDKYRFVDGVG
jgi:hypothetical protein